MSAQYRITTKIGDMNKPLLAMKIQVEHELLLDSDRLDDLKTAKRRA
jgi:hypothetical protein